MELKEHQKICVDLMIKHASGFMNQIDMGGGKSATVVVSAHKLGVSRVLIVCPKSLQLNWTDEWVKWMPDANDWDMRLVVGSKKKKQDMFAKVCGKTVVIIGYDSIAGVLPSLVKYNPELIVADESHMIKSHKTRRWKGLVKIPSLYKYALTGTPTPNGPLDIWAQFNWIRPKHLPENFYVFRARYADVYTGGGFPMIRKYRNIDEKTKEKGFPEDKLLNKLVSQYSYRITKEECLDLPEKIFQDVAVELTDRTRSVYSEMLDEMVAEIGESEVVATTALVKLLRLRQITSGFVTGVDGSEMILGSEKVDVVSDLLESLATEKVVIWCTFIREIKMVSDLVKKLKRRLFVLDGSVSVEGRHQAIKEFAEPNENSVLVCNTSVGGVGLNITCARYAIYYSRSFSYGDYEQSLNRLHRIGQTHKVTYYHLVARKTVDQRIASALAKKEDFMNKLTGDDIRRIGMGL